MKAKNLSRVFNYLLLFAIATLLGILSRKFGSFLPDFLARYTGDTLWAFALYYVLAILFLKRSFGFKFFWTCLVSALDELSQLYHAPWIDELRSTTVGALILGNTFIWTDLLCYLAGAVLAVVIDYSIVRTK